MFILLPFLPEDTLNELSEKHGKEGQSLYQILVKHPDSFEKLVNDLAAPLFFELLEEFYNGSVRSQSRNRIQLIVDDTFSPKFGHCMEFIHKLFVSSKKRYIMGYNYVFVTVVSGNFRLKLFVGLWRSSPHSKHRSKNDMLIDFIKNFHSMVIAKGYTLSEVEITFDSAYCVQKVMRVICDIDLRVITKPSQTQKFEFEGQSVTPKQLIEKVKNGHWKYLAPDRFYQRYRFNHSSYGEVVLIVSSIKLKNGKIIW